MLKRNVDNFEGNYFSSVANPLYKSNNKNSKINVCQNCAQKAFISWRFEKYVYML